MNNKIIGTRAGWEKYTGNPVLGGALGTCFDISVLQQEDGYKMYFSWRPKASVAVSESIDGYAWSKPHICIGPRATKEGWEDDLNRPAVLYKDGVYHMWYTGQFRPGEADGTSHLFYAVSEDGLTFRRVQNTPVLVPEREWEKVAVMCPDVLWDEEEQLYKMWFSGGEQYEPNAIGYATSKNGINWQKNIKNPIFHADANSIWERHKAAGCHVAKQKEWYYMFYIGYYDEHYAQIGIARSKDGIMAWERHPMNPVIAPTPGAFDGEACYKPYAIFDGEKWMLWYNGRNGSLEQIGVAVHGGFDLNF